MEEETLKKERSRYKPDIDLRGSGKKDFGHCLAEIIIEKEGIKEISLSKLKSIIKKPIKEIITLTPKEIGASPDADFRVKEYFKTFMKEGYEVNKRCTKMNKTDRWNYFIEFLKENGYFS